jgi:hypothetical protein
MSASVLMITALLGAENCVTAIERDLGLGVELVPTRKAALTALRRREYSIVIFDDCLAEADPAGADLVWKHAGLAIPLQVNFALASTSRVMREVRSALGRRAQEQALALRAAAGALEGELKATVTGLLLQSQLALADPALPPHVAAKLKVVADLAGTLRRQLQRPGA